MPQRRIACSLATALTATTAAFMLGSSPPVHAAVTASPRWVRVAGQAPVYEVLGQTLYHVPDPQIFAALGGRWSAVRTLSSLSGYSLGLPMVVPFPSGTVIKTANSSMAYWVDAGVLHLLADTAVAQAMERQAVAVQTVSALKPNWPIGQPVANPFPFYPTGTVIKAAGNPTVYEVIGDTLSPIASPAVFLRSGYHWAQIRIVPGIPALPLGPVLTHPYHAYPTGSLLRITGHSKVYVDQNGTWRHIPTPALLHALGYHFSDVIAVAGFLGNPVGPALGSIGSASSTSPAPSSGSSSPSNTPPPNSSSSPPASDPSSPPMPLAPISGFQSMGFGYFADNAPNGTQASSYQDLLAHGTTLSAINPDWYFVEATDTGGWTVHDWTTSIPPVQGQSNATVVTQAAHAEHVLVLPTVAIYYDPAAGPITTAADRQALVQQLVALVTRHGYDGLTIDFESHGTGGLSRAQAADQYTQFIEALGIALHHIGKRLMIAVYASPYPATIYNYAALAPYVDWINIMAYPEHNSATPAGPTQGYPWVQAIVQKALATGVDPAKIILGVAPYGHSWTYTNTSWQGHTYSSDRTVQQYIQKNSIVPMWDPREKALVFTTGPLAATPPAPLTDGSADTAAVANLQAILNVALLDYAVAHHQTPPAFLWAAGTYGSVTQQAVTLFQQDYQLQGVTPGVYDVTTAMVLNQVIAQDHIGQTQWWVNTSRSVGDLVQLALQDHLGGIAMWRLPFEGPNYWNTVSGLTPIGHP